MHPQPLRCIRAANQKSGCAIITQRQGDARELKVFQASPPAIEAGWGATQASLDPAEAHPKAPWPYPIAFNGSTMLRSRQGPANMGLETVCRFTEWLPLDETTNGRERAFLPSKRYTAKQGKTNDDPSLVHCVQAVSGVSSYPTFLFRCWALCGSCRWFG